MNYIKKVKSIVDGKWYYEIQINTFLWFWRKEYGSFDKQDVDDKFIELSRCSNIMRSY